MPANVSLRPDLKTALFWHQILQNQEPAAQLPIERPLEASENSKCKKNVVHKQKVVRKLLNIAFFPPTRKLRCGL
jgi:hypothetical protein